MNIMRNGNSGFTLIETLTSATVFSIAVVALVAVVRTGRQLEITDLHRRRARAIVDSCFEDSVYNFLNYDDIPPIAANAGSTVVIDPRVPADPDDDLPGTLWVDISILTSPLEHKKLVASVRWREPEGMDTVRLEK
ncbi:MAG: prepilin-type N-terminal cleavage/methylation domain-containing protein, partial [Chitinivibrionales bacterium]|nr:prepilin-type N-terminal cleavage/methylation domain-containing protein [Chitinivibrionales bacterium]MBD3357598.1 prepilin-type N-terminal cleavage/methylation domain-containing protein [Chitinivibrionales bacterium]